MVLVAASALKAAPALDDGPPPVELVVRGEPSFRHAGYYAAQWNGWFAEEGVSVVLRHAGADEVVVDRVLSGTGRYGIGAEDILVARLEGKPLVLLAALEQETAQALAVSVAQPAKSPIELRGKRVALLPPVQSAPLQLMLLRAGAGPKDATWLAPWDAQAGEIDGGFHAWQVDARKPYAFVLRPADHGVVTFYGDSLYTTEAELAYHPERVRALRRAVLRGWDHALTRTGDMIAAFDSRRAELGLVADAEELAREAEMIRSLVKPSTVALGAVDETRVREMAQGLVELGLAPGVALLENFVYSPPPSWLPRWVYWVGGALAVVTAAGFVVLVFNVRLQRRVLEQTAELRRSEERARELFERAPVAMVERDYRSVCVWLEARRAAGVTDLEAWLDAHPEAVLEQYHAVRLVQANVMALRASGAGSIAAYAQSTTLERGPHVETAFRAQLLALWRGDRQLTLDVSFLREDGTETHGLLQWSVPYVDGMPDYSRVLVVTTDITALRQAEARLRESEARFRALFESAIEGVYESTPESGVTIANPAFARMLGCDSPEVLVNWFRNIGADRVYVDPLRRQQFLAAIGKVDVLFDFESEVHCGDGSRKWISENVRAIRDDDGKLLRLQGFVTDISDRKRFEQALGEERERLAVTLRAMTESVITTDSHGIVQYINEAAEHLTGWAEGAAIGRPLTDICALRHERTRAAVVVPFEAALHGETVVDLPRSTQLIDRQGHPRLVEGRCAPIHDINSRPVGVVLVLRDAAERSRLEAEMLRTSKLESLGVLAGGIAHDFNNLLTVILGNVTLAQLDASVVEAAGRWLKDAETAAVRARGLTQQLLTFAKGGDPVRTTVRLTEVVREAADFALHGSRVRCEFDIMPDLWPADVDKGQMGQVVQNLVINAVQAMPDGGVVRIRLVNEQHTGDPVRAITPGAYLRLEIADEGVGIKPDNLVRIFDPYFTTKATGSGLGLAMVYSIVKKHDGHIEVDSEIGRGTTFRILLPAHPSAQPVAQQQESEATGISGRVLFMDDEESICRMVTTLLEKMGFSVTAVREGGAVLREYTRAQQSGRPFDVVLMDLTVPGGMGGRDAMEALRQMDPGVKAVVSSGYSSDPVLANYREHGFRGRVVKPYRAADLAKVLREVMAEPLPRDDARQSA